MTNPLLIALDSERIARFIAKATKRIIYTAPSIHLAAAKALVEQRSLDLTISVDFDDKVLRSGYGSLKAIEFLKRNGIAFTHSPGLRCAILIIDQHGWIYTPTALYLEQEPQSDETPNAVALSPKQVKELAIRLSPTARQAAIDTATTPEEAQKIQEAPIEIGIEPIQDEQFEKVKESDRIAPPVAFDLARQVRVFESYLQYVEVSLQGAAIQRHRIKIPQAFQRLGINKEMEGKLKSTFDLISKDSKLSSKHLEDKLKEIRKDFTPSLGKHHGRVILKSAKPTFQERLQELRNQLEEHQKSVKADLQQSLENSKQELLDYYLPLIRKHPPDSLIARTIDPESEAKNWIEDELNKIFPTADALIKKMTLEEHYKDITFESLNQADFMESIRKAFPWVNWDKAYSEFKAAAEKDLP